MLIYEQNSRYLSSSQSIYSHRVFLCIIRCGMPQWCRPRWGLHGVAFAKACTPTDLPRRRVHASWRTTGYTPLCLSHLWKGTKVMLPGAESESHLDIRVEPAEYIDHPIKCESAELRVADA